MSLGGGDPQVLLRRIRHGFIVCDDTELCDRIISQEVENEQRRRKLAQSKAINIDKMDLLTLLRDEPDFILDELSHSPEWTANNVQVRRVRCETLGRLDEIKTENAAKRKVKVISWQNPKVAKKNRRIGDESNSSSDDEFPSSSLIQRRFEPMFPLVRPSPLTALLRSGDHNRNPFLRFAKFDSSTNVGSTQSKRVTIHFKFHKQKLPVSISSSATVEDAIGFICYKYTAENREPLLTQKETSKYLLCIADDDGQAEEDFPPLINNKPFNQYDFPHLMLIQTSNQPSESMASSSSSSSVPTKASDEDSSVIDSSRSVTPSPSEIRRSIGSNDKATASATVEDPPDEADPIKKCFSAYDSLNQRSYFFDFYIKPSSTKHIKVQLDVSGEQIRLELLEKTSKLSWQQMSITIQHLVDCTIIDKDAASSKKDRARIRLKFESQQESSGDRILQNFDFESTLEQVEKFHDQISNIIQVRNPQARDTYEHQLQQEQQDQRHSVTRKKLSLLSLISGISGSSSSTKS